ncbi:oligopeptide/dipeptide ABC transporter ATP-binding protein [Oceanotoga teriensis]|uniref:Oligopeptide/dipeptide ABC transporter ATP-binding protein n=1 Tax=Oceanotoga teriensis TaxID=515440 RepID=A0AA45C6C6_9BACT|nr:oligopeptide/dipeptide ABC transporter ATP-binding protein [Oceanotoga teriensis]PWJ92039.1 oligopeptide/dipeptide ABC transporter ATP-binding protein [Oceanotoga teriensis]
MRNNYEKVLFYSILFYNDIFIIFFRKYQIWWNSENNKFIMYNGDILEIGNSSDIINDPFHPYTKLLKSAAPKPESGLKPERIDTKGEIPDLTDLPSGCSFHPRCPFASDLCRSFFSFFSSF